MSGASGTITTTNSSSTSGWIYLDLSNSATTDYTITWYDSNGFNVKLSALEQMKQDFEALANLFFQENYDVPFVGYQCPPDYALL